MNWTPSDEGLDNEYGRVVLENESNVKKNDNKKDFLTRLKTEVEVTQKDHFDSKSGKGNE